MYRKILAFFRNVNHFEKYDLNIDWIIINIILKKGRDWNIIENLNPVKTYSNIPVHIRSIVAEKDNKYITIVHHCTGVQI